MAWTTPVDQATGFLVTAAIYNAHIIDNLAYLHGDGGATIDVSVGGQALLAKSLQIGTSDTTLIKNVVSGFLAIGGTSSAGNLACGLRANTGAAGAVGIDASYLLNRFSGTTVGTYTFSAPINPPGAAQSALLCIIFHNATGGVSTLAWNAVYAGVGAVTGAVPGNGFGLMTLFVWNGATSKWDMVAVNSPGVSD
jgi:hypothetical protein